MKTTNKNNICHQFILDIQNKEYKFQLGENDTLHSIYRIATSLPAL